MKNPTRSTAAASLVLAVSSFFAVPAFCQVVARIEGIAADEAGNPLEAVEISLRRVDTNALLKPAKTSKKGSYLYIVEPGEYILIAKKEGYLVVRQLSEITNGDGVKNSITYFFNEKQEFEKKVHVFATGDLTSKSRNKIDWVLTTPDKHMATVNKLYAEYKGVPATDPGKPAEPGQALPPPTAGTGDKKTSFELAMDKLDQKDYAGAIPLLKESVEKAPDDPNNAEGYYRLGRSQFETDALADAETSLKKAKALDPTKTGVSFYLARVYDKKGRKIQAVQALEDEKTLSPDSEAVVDALAGLYSDTGQPDKAIELYQGMIAHNPDDLDAYTSLAALYKETGNKAKEEEMYTKLGDRDPTGKSLYNLGNLAFNRDEPQKADVYYKKVLEKDPNHAMAHFQLAYTLVKLGDFPGAVGHFETFLKLSPKDAKAAEAKQMVQELKKLAPPGKAASKG
ncbi:MAG: tetratricopeptide repeat protein [Acidobacteria bacterium]|nr:tetratricopeptide repeat protein [Acidobacteriota bacterium]